MKNALTFHSKNIKCKGKSVRVEFLIQDTEGL